MTEVAKAPDWEAIERDYRAGVLSVRAIADREGITEGAVRKRSKGNPAKGIPAWERNLAGKVLEAAKNKALRDIGADANTDGTHDGTHPLRANRKNAYRNEREAIEVTATAIANTLSNHRQDIREARKIVQNLLGELGDLGDGSLRQLLMDLSKQSADEQDDDKIRSAMSRALSLGSRAGISRDLISALKTAIELERQALQVDNPPPPEPEKPKEGATMVPMVDVQALFAKVRGRDGAGEAA